MSEPSPPGPPQGRAPLNPSGASTPAEDDLPGNPTSGCNPKPRAAPAVRRAGRRRAARRPRQRLSHARRLASTPIPPWMDVIPAVVALMRTRGLPVLPRATPDARRALEGRRQANRFKSDDDLVWACEEITHLLEAGDVELIPPGSALERRAAVAYLRTAPKLGPNAPRRKQQRLVAAPMDVNDATRPTVPFNLPSIETIRDAIADMVAAGGLEEDVHMAATDISAAYHHGLLDPEWSHLLSFQISHAEARTAQAHGVNIRPGVYRFTCLPFGYADSAWAFDVLLDAYVSAIARSTVFRSTGAILIRYADDVFVIGPTRRATQVARALLDDMLAEAGWAVDPEKGQAAGRVCTMIGWRLDLGPTPSTAAATTARLAPGARWAPAPDKLAGYVRDVRRAAQAWAGRLRSAPQRGGVPMAVVDARWVLRIMGKISAAARGWPALRPVRSVLSAALILRETPGSPGEEDRRLEDPRVDHLKVRKRAFVDWGQVRILEQALRIMADGADGYPFLPLGSRTRQVTTFSDASGAPGGGWGFHSLDPGFQLAGSLPPAIVAARSVPLAELYAMARAVEWASEDGPASVTAVSDAACLGGIWRRGGARTPVPERRRLFADAVAHIIDTLQETGSTLRVAWAPRDAGPQARADELSKTHVIQTPTPGGEQYTSVDWWISAESYVRLLREAGLQASLIHRAPDPRAPPWFEAARAWRVSVPAGRLLVDVFASEATAMTDVFYAPGPVRGAAGTDGLRAREWDDPNAIIVATPPRSLVSHAWTRAMTARAGVLLVAPSDTPTPPDRDLRGWRRLATKPQVVPAIGLAPDPPPWKPQHSCEGDSIPTTTAWFRPPRPHHAA